MSRSDFDFGSEDRPRFRARRVDERPEPAPLVEIAGKDVCEAVKQGFGMAFFIGIAAGVAVMFANAHEPDYRSGPKYLQTIVLCLVFLPMLWVPLALGARATSKRKDFTAGLLRFGALLFLAAYAVAVIAVVGMVLYVRLAKLGR